MLDRYCGKPATTEDLDRAKDRVLGAIEQLKTGVGSPSAPVDSVLVAEYAEAVADAVAEWTADLLEILGTLT